MINYKLYFIKNKYAFTMSLLIIGGTGTLGRQIVKKALDEGFPVKCLVRNFKKATFLKEWGAELIYGDLKIPETIPPALYGITALIDASTNRAFDQDYNFKIDLDGKVALIKAAEEASIQRFIFFSFFLPSQYKEIPLINLKLHVENKLQKSKIPYTIFCLCGFFQGLISQYAIPILDKQSIWVTTKSNKIAYIDTQDVAKFAVKSLSIPALENKKIPLIGPKSWNAQEIIVLCEKLSGQKAKISQIPILLLQILRNITKFFQWTWTISDRLAFIEILARDYNLDTSMEEVFKIYKLDKQNLITLEEYLQEYFVRIMKKIKAINLQSNIVNQENKF
jgi:uncharacterized protein YbjT (DUF2867 family)